MELGTGRQLFPRCLDLVKNGDNQQFSCQVTFSSQVDTFEFWKHIYGKIFYLQKTFPLNIIHTY